MMKELEKRLQYTYKNIEYLRTALTHSSYANEDVYKRQAPKCFGEVWGRSFGYHF